MPAQSSSTTIKCHRAMCNRRENSLWTILRLVFLFQERVQSYDDLREMDVLIFDLAGIRRLIRWSCSPTQDSKQR